MDGIINIYKEEDFTSFDVVAKLRGILHTRKIGHTGTLDPMATGVLPVCVGSATKLCDLLTDHDKVYETTMILGVTYDTLDVTGTQLTENIVMSTQEEITNVIKSFVGGYDQVPPMYSAKKIDGKKLYELAREGKEIVRKPVHVDIFSIEIMDINIPRVSFRVHCGKGTYIRSLINDIGASLGCGAAMESLKRTKVGDFDINTAMKLSEVENCVADDSMNNHIIPVDFVFSDCRDITIPHELCKLIDNGNVINEECIKLIDSSLTESLIDKEKIRVYDFNNEFRAVYEYNKLNGTLKPYKMFISAK